MTKRISNLRVWSVLLAALLWSMCLGAAQQYIRYTVAGVFTENFTGAPTIIQVGEPFQASYTFFLPSSETVIGPGLSQHTFSAASVSGVLGTNAYDSSTASVYLWEPPVSDDTVEFESNNGALTLRVVLASSDPTAVNTSVVPTALSLSQFDLRRELQVFGGGISLVGRIDSISVVPEPGVWALVLTGLGGVVAFGRLNPTKANSNLRGSSKVIQSIKD